MTVITVVLLVLLLVSVWAGFYQLVKQQGRMLLRLDKLEEAAKAAAASAAESDPGGLPVGSDFPAFRFPDLAGKEVALEDFRGKRPLLIQWNFQCGFCESIAGELAQLDSRIGEQNAQLALLAFGDAKLNQEQAAEHGLKCRILLMKDNERPAPFADQGTPVAYLLDGEGRVAAPIAVGADPVLDLARELASPGSGSSTDRRKQTKLPGEKSLGESRIEREGLKAGTPAPLFRLPDLQGRSVALEEYRGRRVLLVFSDPNCGPCDELAPHLVRLHQEHGNNGSALIYVGRGDEAENRRKAKQHGFEFPVVLQEKWKVSKEYGIFATPIAFLIGEDGVIAKNVAVGKDAILAVARDWAASQTEG